MNYYELNEEDAVEAVTNKVNCSLVVVDPDKVHELRGIATSRLIIEVKQAVDVQEGLLLANEGVYILSEQGTEHANC